IAPWVPFIVAFGLIGIVMAVLIVANVVSGAVVAGTRRIGVLKSVGFSPAQVVAAYALQVTIPAAAGAVAGVLAGNLLSVPLLSQTARVYGVGALAVPPWVDVAVPLAMLGLTVAAALPPALRAGRLSAVQAIATGRAPRAARADPGHAGGGAARRHRGDVRGRPGHLPGPGGGRPVPRAGRTRSDRPARRGRRAPAAGCPPDAQPGRAAARRPGRAAGAAGDAALRGRSRRRHQRARPAGAAVTG